MYVCLYVCTFSLCLLPPQPSYKEEATKGGRVAFGRPPPFCEISYGGWGGSKFSKDIQTYKQIYILHISLNVHHPSSEHA